MEPGLVGEPDKIKHLDLTGMDDGHAETSQVGLTARQRTELGRLVRCVCHVASSARAFGGRGTCAQHR